MKTENQDRSVIVQPDEGDSFWQPVPANGHVELKSSGSEGGANFDCGVQSVAPGGHVREHAHDGHEELIFVYEGTGTAVVNGETHPMQAGTTLHLRSMHRHKFINTGDEALRFFWVLMPGGLTSFFASIGRSRMPGEPPPAPFPRPENVAEIEAVTVFARLSNDEGGR